jgi:hypothetical protein
MKRISVFLIALILMSATYQSAKAQDTNRWDARLGVGFFGLQDFIPLLTIGLGEDIDRATNVDFRFLPLITPSFEISYECNKYISVGGQLTLGYATAKYEYIDDGARGRSSMIYPTLMANLKVNYLKSGSFSMYGLFGLGASTFIWIDNSPYYSKEMNFTAIPMFNFYPLCFSTNKDNGFYMEVGYGSKGWLNLGWEMKL